VNGFDTISLDEVGLVDRLLRRKPRGNALKEIHNLLATTALPDLTAADVENVLSAYEVSRTQARDGLLELYRAAVEFRLRDRHLSDEDVADLRRLRYVLGLDDDDAGSLEREQLRSVYRHHLKSALADGVLSAEEKADLAAMVANFRLPEDVRLAVYKEEAESVIQQAFRTAIADQRLTHEEERRLALMSQNLGVAIAQSADAQRQLERFRLLAQVENGQLPDVQSPLILQRGERCHARFTCALHEMRTVTKAVSYHGPAGRIRIMKGLSWRYGYVNVNRITKEELKLIDTGELLVTNKRLLFNGAKRNTNVPLKRVVHFTMYKDGVQIEKDSGRDQFFIGSGDIELLGLILEGVLGMSR
jgi:hypothetical protein